MYRSFEGGPLMIPTGSLRPVPLQPTDGVDEGIQVGEAGDIRFAAAGWYEVLLRVAWDHDNSDGSRFSHSKVPGQQPLHSEAISASVLARISEGAQLLRANTVFGNGGPDRLLLEVWQDSGTAVEVRQAELKLRRLDG